MNILLIGNSHLAAVKRAWDSSERKDNPTLAFFGSSGTTAQALIRDGQQLVATTNKLAQSYKKTGGASAIDVADYDAAVIVGLGFDFRSYLAMLKRHLPADILHHRPQSQILSAAAYAQAVNDNIARSPGYRIAEDICAIRNMPIIYVPSPAPTETILSSRDFKSFAPYIEGGFLDTLYDRFMEIALATAESKGLVFIHQPQSTFARKGLTKLEYSTDSQAAGWTLGSMGPDARADDWHMNAQYGAVVLDLILAALPDATTPTAMEARAPS